MSTTTLSRKPRLAFSEPGEGRANRFPRQIVETTLEQAVVVPAYCESVVHYLVAYGAKLSSKTLRTHLAALT